MSLSHAAPSSTDDASATSAMKRLSVVITNYNYEQYLAMAISSALDLRWDDIEVIVVDDGSTDGHEP